MRKRLKTAYANRKGTRSLSWDDACGSPYPLKVIDVKYDKRRDEVPHSHAFHEIVFVKNGSGLHETEGTTYPIFHGDLFYIPPNAPHSYQEIKGLEIINVIYIPELLDIHFKDLRKLEGFNDFFGFDLKTKEEYKHFFNLDAEAMRIFNEIILEMTHEQNNRNPGYEFYMKLGLERIFGLICRFKPNAGELPDVNVPRLIRVLRFIEKNFQGKILKNDLAAISGMSYSSFLRIFQKELGENPSEYILNLRLKKAAEQLRRSKNNITEIAFSSGFNDSGYFSKMFQREYSISPREYRKLTRQ